MATATKKAGAAKPATRDVRDPSLEFLIYRDTGGDYHWEVVDDGGESLVHSGGFASHDDATRAARYVYEGAHSARFGPDVPAGRQTAAA
jgi:uncharacterized protein YegP (UPF0339 family)